MKVNKYNVSENQVSDSVKKDIKWMLKVGNNSNERLVVDGVVVTGDEIEVLVQVNWAGEKLIFMPYLNIPTPQISYQPQISENIFKLVIGQMNKKNKFCS